MSKMYSYTSKIGVKSEKFYSSKEKMMEQLTEDWRNYGAGMLLDDALKANLIKISEFEAE